MAIDTSVGSHRLLVVANEACAGDALLAEIRKRTGEGGEVLPLMTTQPGWRISPGSANLEFALRP